LKGFNVTVARDGQTGLKAVLARDEILNSALGCTHFISASDINSFIETIREKVEPDLQKPRFIHSMGKTGYKFEPV
jgi:DNA-binding response OmpR family regulator